MSGPPRADIGALVVDAQKRKLGVGRRLVSAAESWAKEQGYSRMWLSSQTKREEAHEFYKRLGYSINKTSYFFEKELSSGNDR